MVFGDGIRRNIVEVSQAERDAFIAAILALNADPYRYPGGRVDNPTPTNPTGGVTYWFKQDEIHASTHVHGVPAFLPWHRELVNRFEVLLRKVNPKLSLHYWDWTQDPQKAPDGKGGFVNLFQSNFMGSAHSPTGQPALAGEPLKGAGFYNEAASPYRSNNPFGDGSTNNPYDPPRDITRNVQDGLVQSKQSDQNMVQNDTFTQFWQAMEGAHFTAHVQQIRGTIADAHLSFRDPFVFLLHSNVDRLFALWQLSNKVDIRLDPDLVYDNQEASTGSGDITDAIWGILSPIEPWAGPAAQTLATGVVTNVKETRPWAAPENEQLLPENQKNHKHWTIVKPPCYDTNPTVLEVLNPGKLIDFNQVVQGETTVRAARFKFMSCYPMTFTVTSLPSLPFLVYSSTGGVLGKVGPVAESKDSIWTEALLWFSFTGDAPNSSSSSSATIHCECQGFSQDITFTLSSFSIARPTAAVVLVLDQSGSMDDPAGTSGLKRIDALKEAANVFVEVIQSGNAIGVVNFDTTAYAVDDPTYPGLQITTVGDGVLDLNRSHARDAVNRHKTNPFGSTSIGAGIVEARQLLNTAGIWDVKAMVVFTDGIENTLPYIKGILSNIDDRTYAIGLGSPEQISTTALNQITNATGGYTYITGSLSSSTDDLFKATKYFLQILAGVTNTQIVQDPSGFVPHNVTVEWPFTVADVDIETTVVLNCDLPALTFNLLSPSSKLVTPTDATPGSGIAFYNAQLTQYYRLTFPVTVKGTQEGVGTWKAVLRIDEGSFKRYCRGSDDQNPQQPEVPKILAQQQQMVLDKLAVASITPCTRGGIRYNLGAYAWSNLRMKTDTNPSVLLPGDKYNVRALLDEFGIPFQYSTISATITKPDGTTEKIGLGETAAGVYQASTVADIPGVYSVRVTASGVTSEGTPFTREAVLTVSAFAGANDPLPGSGGPRNGDPGDGGPGNGGPGNGEGSTCCLMKALLHNESVCKFMKKHELDPASVLKSVEECCECEK